MCGCVCNRSWSCNRLLLVGFVLLVVDVVGAFVIAVICVVAAVGVTAVGAVFVVDVVTVGAIVVVVVFLVALAFSFLVVLIVTIVVFLVGVGVLIVVIVASEAHLYVLSVITNNTSLHFIQLYAVLAPSTKCLPRSSTYPPRGAHLSVARFWTKNNDKADVHPQWVQPCFAPVFGPKNGPRYAAIFSPRQTPVYWPNLVAPKCRKRKTDHVLSSFLLDCV